LAMPGRNYAAIIQLLNAAGRCDRQSCRARS
jgi:hypothetical protein